MPVQQFEDPNESQSITVESSSMITLAKPQINISVLKHLSRPLEILQTQQIHLKFNDPVCVYRQQLKTVPQRILPNEENTLKCPITQTRLSSLQNSQFQFQQVKKLFQKARYKTQSKPQYPESQQSSQYNTTKTLHSVFWHRKPYYCRFQSHFPSKNNFSNVFVDVAGLNLSAKNKNSAERRLSKVWGNCGEKRYNTGSLVFDSAFQSGNLLYVYDVRSQTDQRESGQYQLILQNDTNTYGHNQWFFFRVQSLKPHNTVKFSIMNLIKPESLFSYGLKPLVFSQKQNQSKSLGWQRRGQNLKYFANQIRRQNNNSQSYYTLQFQFTFTQPNDWVYFCPSYPYTYTQMTTYFENLYYQPDYRKCFSVKTLCETLGKNKVNLVTIGTGVKPVEECKVVWVLARQHPAETTGSYMVEGIVRYLLPLVLRAKGDAAKGNRQIEKLNDYVFKIVPMVNVDGVIHGNSRAELVGLDPNRTWKNPRKLVSPAVYHILKEIQAYKCNTSLVLDLHSHSKKTGCFFYGNSFGSSSNLSKLYPTLICQNDHRFTLKHCRFSGGYKTTLRHILFKQLSQRLQNIFTVECSLLGYLNPKTNRVTQYTIKDLHEMGAKLMENFFRLENIRVERDISEVIGEFMAEMDSVVEVDEAKSEDGVSEDQYEEVRMLEKRLVVRKKHHTKKDGVRNVINKTAVSNNSVSVAKPQLTQNKIRQRACSLANKQPKPSPKLQSLSQQKPSTAFNPKPHAPKPTSQLYLSTKSVQQQNQQETSQVQNPQFLSLKNNILKQSYMKYLSGERFERKGRREVREVGVQVVGGELGECGGLLAISNKLGSDSRQVRPLLILGTPCHSQFYLYPNNEISIQINPQPSLCSKQQQALTKLPKLLNLISSSKMKKLSLASYKQNHLLTHVPQTTKNTSKTTGPIRYNNDTKSLIYDDKKMKALGQNLRNSQVGKFRSLNNVV